MKKKLAPNFNVCGIPIQNANLQEMLSLIGAKEKQAGKGVGSAFCFINSNSIVEAESNLGYRELLVSNAYNFADGTPVFAISLLKNFANRAAMRKVPGPDFFNAYFSTSTYSANQYFIGTDEVTLKKLAQRTGLEYSPDRFFSPPHSSDLSFLSEVISAFLDKKPSGVVWLGLGGTKQDTISISLARLLPHCFVGVGAALDFYSGVKIRSPKIINSMGLEWLFRLVNEPKRLAKRYFLGNLAFLRIAISKEVITPCMIRLRLRK